MIADNDRIRRRVDLPALLRTLAREAAMMAGTVLFAWLLIHPTEVGQYCRYLVAGLEEGQP